MASAELKPEASRNFLTDLAPWADTLSKSVAAIAIAVYVCGFLVISLHHSKYGFIGTNPLRPRILAAGAWFLFFSAIPVLVATRYRERDWIRIAESLFFVWSAFFGIARILFYVLFDSSRPSFPTHSNWLFWLWFAGLVLAFALYLFVRDSKTVPAYLLAVSSVAIVLFAVAFRLQTMFTIHDFEEWDLANWFFGVFLVTVLELKARPPAFADKFKGLGVDLGLLFLTVFVFAHYYYPHLEASWGGGTPVSVTVYFTKESALDPNKAVTAQLIEECDEGFYIIGPEETRAIFVPRSSVALVYFSDKPAESPLLREGK